VRLEPVKITNGDSGPVQHPLSALVDQIGLRVAWLNYSLPLEEVAVGSGDRLADRFGVCMEPAARPSSCLQRGLKTLPRRCLHAGSFCEHDKPICQGAAGQQRLALGSGREDFQLWGEHQVGYRNVIAG